MPELVLIWPATELHALGFHCQGEICFFSMGNADAMPFWHCQLLAARACVYLKMGIPPPKYPKMASLVGIIIND